MKKTLVYTASFIVIIIIGVGLVSWNQSKNASSDETEKMIALGDSLTYGIGDESGHGYVENMEKLLKENKEADIKVENYGIPDQQTDGLLKQVNQTDVKSDLGNADYFILFIGTNDLIESNGGDLTEINEEKIEVGKADYEQNLEEIIEVIRGENEDAPILFLGLYNPYPDSEEIEEEVVEWNDNSQTIVDDYDRIKFISTNDLFKEKSSEYFSDALHPNKKGYDLITEKIVEEYDF
ncbi:hypothetical protein GCM10010954_26990 [Halobacillus andaensis]|uniref:SGNH hydrolase-type esterase domain-containing protein n=1 Tax=Halobacillus andaensis TaxID=1176239 RepID=A0A917B6X1_HALAA|nr:GDSL-type esterase/lipase family protein [Halobacillus andaensis]MBP2005716.1 lysophospholipase L1-like esterase [Halobacillus andaensis]GGF26541.1 hypothetical protein GCM10010954_26990 [Halobacillus andaensis]